MRDPQRIDRMIDLLRRRWHENPDLRLGQLIVNTAGKSDPFYVEDDEMEQRLTKLRDADPDSTGDDYE